MIKHYTPSRDEFYEGFPFERKENDSWAKINYTGKEPIEDILNIRVKYLDLDDIRELGFRYSNEEDGEYMFYKEIPSLLVGDMVELYYTKIGDEPYISIKLSSGKSLIKDLNIKNIHELKWILNRYDLV